MRSTLFYIPAELAGLPVFGFGWLLGAWILFCLALLAWAGRRSGGSREATSYLPIMIVVAVVIAFLLPNMIESTPEGRPLGVPIRGFGVMLMLATVAGVFGVQVADAFTAFGAASLPAGGSACAAGLLIPLPGGVCDIHPSAAGQALIAQTVLELVAKK